MEVIEKKHQATVQALKTLHEALQKLDKPSLQEARKEIRDSVIQRFEYSIDTLWKFLKEYLSAAYKVNVTIPTPKQVFKTCLDVQLIDAAEYETLLKIIEDRNLTSHTYNEELAERISAHIQRYYATMQSIISRIPNNVEHP